MEAAAARENGQDERLIVEKERAHKKLEAEIERKHQRERAEHERELANLAAHRKVLASNETKFEVSEIPKLKSEARTEEWVRTNFTVQNSPQETKVTRQSHQNPQRQIYPDNPHKPEKSNHINFLPSGLPASCTPILEASLSHLIKSLALSNRKVVAGLSRQNLPKCHPDTFSRDPTLFHKLKEAFKSSDKRRRSLPCKKLFTCVDSQVESLGP